MVKMKQAIFLFLILFFLIFSFSPTIFELSKASHLSDPAREFILEHNYYWPDFNLYLSKIRQGFEGLPAGKAGQWTAMERYTSEPHSGSLLQEFYVVLGQAGRILGLDPNFAYQLGRIILSPLLLLLIMRLVTYFFRKPVWQILAFIIIVVSGSFSKFIINNQGILQIGRYMEWWSNIDALQRITFIPHILFGQVVSFYLLFELTYNLQLITYNKLFFYILLGNLIGLVFPPSLITLLATISLIMITKLFILGVTPLLVIARLRSSRGNLGRDCFSLDKLGIAMTNRTMYINLFFVIFTLPSLLYIFLLTKQLPWSALVDFHRTHPMMIPFTEYILGTGPIFFLGLAGAVISIIKRDRRFQPLIYWIIVTFGFAVFFTHFKDQSPLRFTQTGLFIPLGILGTYFLYQVNLISDLGNLSYLGRMTIKTMTLGFIFLYILSSLYMMTNSLKWQTTFITQRAAANIPLVPYPPQTMYPLKSWMDGIRFLRDNTRRDEVVLAEITAGNYIPAYAGNTVYFGQSNTVDYERKQGEVWRFFKGEMGQNEVVNFFRRGRIKYIFYSVQEKELGEGKQLETIYPSLKVIYSNPIVSIYLTDNK